MGCRSEEHTSELQSHLNLVCRLLLEKKENTRVGVRLGVVAICIVTCSVAACHVVYVCVCVTQCLHCFVVSSCLFCLIFFFNIAHPPKFSPFPHHAALPT